MLRILFRTSGINSGLGVDIVSILIELPTVEYLALSEFKTLEKCASFRTFDDECFKIGRLRLER